MMEMLGMVRIGQVAETVLVTATPVFAFIHVATNVSLVAQASRGTV